MLNKKKIAIAATGIVIMICGVLVYVNFINKEPVYDYTSVPETTITEQYQEVDKGITIILPDSEPVFIEEPVIDWEEPPVVTVYNPIADINNDGHVDKVEWEKWVAAHPEDLNQDLYIEDWEMAEINKTTQSQQEEQKPVEQTKPAENKPAPQKQTESKPVESKPATQKPVEKPTPPATDNGGSSNTGSGSFTDDFLDNWGSGVEGKGSVDDYHKPFDPVQ